jgi:hypothetical protein
VNIDDVPRQNNTSQQRWLRIVSAMLWGLVISGLIALRVNGTSAFEVVDLLQIGGLTLGIGIVVLGVAGILYKTLQYVGMTVTMIVRLFYLVGIVVIGALVSTFVL